MTGIEQNEVTLLSHMIYTIYNTDDLWQMRREFLNLLKYAVPFDTANFFLVTTEDNKKRILTDLVNENTLKNPNVTEILNRYMDTCFEIDNTHWTRMTHKPATYRITDLLSDDTLKASDYYKEMFVPYDLHYGAEVIIAHDNRCLGLLALFRTKDNANFTNKEMLLLDCLNEHLSARLGNSLTDNKIKPPSIGLKNREAYGLTSRENEILDLLLEGLTNEQIIDRLFIAENTLRRHIYNLYKKLGIQERWQLYYL